MEQYEEIIVRLEALKEDITDLKLDHREHVNTSGNFREKVSSNETSIVFLKGWLTAITVGVCYGMWDLIFKGK